MHMISMCRALSYGWTRSVNSGAGWREEQTGCILWTKFEKCKYLILFFLRPLYLSFKSVSPCYFYAHTLLHGQQETVIFVECIRACRWIIATLFSSCDFSFWFMLSCLSSIQFKEVSLCSVYLLPHFPSNWIFTGAPEPTIPLFPARSHFSMSYSPCHRHQSKSFSY